MPDGTNSDWRKIETLEGLYQRLAGDAYLPRIPCGDFNLPICETPDGNVYTGAWQRRGGRLMRWPASEGRNERWETAERAILLGLAALDLPDVFRALYGYEAEAFSYYTRPGRESEGARFGRRFDHVFAARDLGAESFIYREEWRTGGMSDHAGCVVTFAGGRTRA